MSNRVGAARPSAAMRRVLVNLLHARSAWGHLDGRSMHGGSGQTQRAMIQRGWIAWEGELSLTEAGARVAAAHAPVTHITDAELARLIQIHPNIAVVDLLRAERDRRSAAKAENSERKS